MSEDEKVAERVQRSFFSTDRLSKMIIAFDSGDMVELIRLYDEALEQRFEDGIQYAKDTVGEWNKP
jgi:Lhr-like helicase